MQPDETQDIATPVSETPAPASEPVPTSIEPESSQPNSSTPSDLPPEALESPTSDVPIIPVESQNGGVNEPESKPIEPPKEPQIEETPTSPMQPVSAPATRSSRIHPLSPSQSKRQASFKQTEETGYSHADGAKEADDHQRRCPEAPTSLRCDGDQISSQTCRARSSRACGEPARRQIPVRAIK